MPRTAGTYSLPAGSTATPSTTIESAKYNAALADIATALTDSVNKDGTKAFGAAQSFGGFKATSLGTGTARTDGTNLGQVQDGKANWVAAGGSADVITATYSPAITALVDGQECAFRASAANATTTPTFSPNGQPARTIVKRGGSALAAGDIPGAAAEVVLRYNLANTRWEMSSAAAAVASDSSAGLVELATIAETVTGTDATRAVTPAGLIGLLQQGGNINDGAAITIGNGSYFKLVTSTTAITSFVVTRDWAGRIFEVEFDTVRTLTDNANIDIPGGNFVTAVGDVVTVKSNGDGTVKVIGITKAGGPLVMATAQTASGTSVDFPSIPAGTKRIVISLSGVSTNGTSNPIIQIGDSGGVENTGYRSYSSRISNNGVANGANYTAGLGIASSETAAVLNGSVTLTLIDAATFLWSANGFLADSNTAYGFPVSGSKTLTATLDRVRVTTVNGTDTFDSGTINIMFES